MNGDSTALVPSTDARRERLTALTIVAMPFVIGWAVIKPWHDVPVIDDWVYAWSVEHLLRAGELRVSPISAVYPLGQIAWGSLFTWVAGFSFGALRLSTVVLAILGCWSIFLTCRELTVPFKASLLAALTVACHPVYYTLAFSFMTDVPFASAAAISLYFYVSAVQRQSRQRAWCAAAFATFAFLIRPVGIVLPVAMIVAAWWWSRSRAWRLEILPPVVGALCVMLVLQWALPRLLGPLHAQSNRIANLQIVPSILPRNYLAWNLDVLIVSVFPFAPLLLQMLRSGRAAARVALIAVVLAASVYFTLGSMLSPLEDGQTWSLQEMAARTLLGGALTPSAWSIRIQPLIKAGGILVSAAFIVALWRAWRQPASRASIVLVTYGTLQLVLINLFWFFNDRYYLALIMVIAYLAARGLGDRTDIRIAAPVLGLWVFVSITGVHDLLSTNATCAQVARDLEAAGVPAFEIDAGYTLNGWRLYAHPQNLQPGADPRFDVPFVTSERNTLYRILKGPVPEYTIVRAVPLPATTWQVSREVYVGRLLND
jgi:hypothetical protein